MSPVRYRVVTGDYKTGSRDPTNEELPYIRAYHGAYVRERGVEPMCDHEVPGVENLVLFEHIDN
jgi:hypothetical protein